MNRSTPPAREAESQRLLEHLEERVVRGATALAERNVLLSEMAAAGWSQAELTRVLNGVRSRLAAPELSPDAVFAALRRVRALEHARAASPK